MKFLLATQAVLAFAACRVDGTRLGEIHTQEDRDLRGGGGDVEDKVLFLTDLIGPESEKPCAQAKPGSDLIHVADCSKNPPGTIWTLQSNGLLRNEIGGCMQTGHGEFIQDGSHMRLKRCDSSEPFQKFNSPPTDPDAGGGDLTLQSNTNLCVTHATSELNMGNNFLILKECSVLPTKRRNWNISYHVYNYLLNRDGAAESEHGVHIQSADVKYGSFINEHPASNWVMLGDQVINGYGQCLQAGHGAILRDGSHLRVYPCDPHNDLQKFRILDNGNGLFKLKNNDNFCVTVANDFPILILKNCPNNFVYGSRWDWVIA